MLQHTEPGVPLDPWSLFHPCNGPFQEIPNLEEWSAITPTRHEVRPYLIVCALRFAVVVEVLASVFGDPYILAERIMPIDLYQAVKRVPKKNKVEGTHNIGLEFVKSNVVPVKREKVDGAALAGVEEVLHPHFSVRAGGSCWGTETVALGFERFHSLAPEVSAAVGVDS